MSCLSIDYNGLLSSDLPGLPYDVAFLIFDHEKEKQSEVHHKFIFALDSPVFKSRFCSSGNFADMNNREVEIGTPKIFQFLTNFLYKPTTIGELSVDEIFDEVNLARCYHIAKMEEAIEQRLGKLVIALDDGIEAAKISEEFARFAMASQPLLGSCAKSLQAALAVTTLADTEAVFEFSSQVVGTGDVAVCLRLFAMLKGLQSFCSNCSQSSCSDYPGQGGNQAGLPLVPIIWTMF